VYSLWSAFVKNLPAEEEIKARLRELTRETRRVREELQGMIRREPDRARAFSHDRPYRLKRKPKGQT
jgi:hypothetical protein